MFCTVWAGFLPCEMALSMQPEGGETHRQNNSLLHRFQAYQEGNFCTIYLYSNADNDAAVESNNMLKSLSDKLNQGVIRYLGPDVLCFGFMDSFCDG